MTDEWLNSWHGVDEVDPTIDDVYRTRRGYYAMISYIDDKLGELVDELDRNGFGDNTIVVFTSDHGDMVGDHGMFFKRTFREPSSRVPLIVAGPGVVGSERVSAVTSLVDVFPTLVDLAGLPLPERALAASLAGVSLRTELMGEKRVASRHVVIENLAEGTRKPTRTVVQDGFKFVYVADEEELLFDLPADPGEWQNLAADPAHVDRVARMKALCLDNWDPVELSPHIAASQQVRNFIRQALTQGYTTSWDYQPFEDAGRMYVRTPRRHRHDSSTPEQFDEMTGGQ